MFNVLSFRGELARFPLALLELLYLGFPPPLWNDYPAHMSQIP